MDNLGGYYLYGSSNPPVCYRVTHRFQVVVPAVFNVAFAFIMNDVGALFRLFVAMATYFYEGIDNPFKGIHIIVPDDEGKGFFVGGQHVDIFVAVGTYISFCCTHSTHQK